MLMVGVARYAAGKGRPGGTLLFMGGTGGRRPSSGVGISSAMTAALPALTASLALEVAPVRVNLIAAGFVDTPLSASLLGDALEARRQPSRHASDRARRRTGRRRRPGRARHVRHGAHRRDLRHRRRPAAPPRVSSTRRARRNVKGFRHALRRFRQHVPRLRAAVGTAEGALMRASERAGAAGYVRELIGGPASS
jgi:NAD(P)-dependent dehydrogenase (short-subunit alcohol dehydrogenase family)